MFLLIIPLAIAIGLLIIRATSLGKSEAQGGFASRGDRVLIVTAHPDDETMVAGDHWGDVGMSGTNFVEAARK